MRVSAQDPLLYSATHSHLPWNSADATVKDARTIPTADVYTDQRIIDMCLGCTAPECYNCLESWTQITKIRPTKAERKMKTKRKRK